MNTRMVIFCVVLYLQFLASFATQLAGQPLQRKDSVVSITQKEAIAIANRHARKKHKRLERFTIIPCEGLVLWRIIYDGGGPEYVIDKRGGMIIKIERIPQSSHSSESNAGANRGQSVSEREAITIAKTDARAEYGDKEDIDKYEVRACEQAKVWRIVFDFKPPMGSRDGQFVLPNGSMPQYVIDKASGKIIYRARD